MTSDALRSGRKSRDHLMTSELLTPAQMQRYAQLRGYIDENSGTQHTPNH